jgi:hypothetical protein
MILKNLEATLDKMFGPFSEERTIILNAAKKDIDSMTSVASGDDVLKILNIFNEVFQKKSRVMTKKVVNKYKDILRHFSLDDIKSAMENAKDDEFHQDNNYKYCTIEYFSRLEQIDKWTNVTKEDKKKEGFVMPKFNVRG